ncbi:EAL domain-containing protein [Giesbergeria anulus]|uniref:PAS domain S-box-containing protein/diguanylate cyclase (GGDEF) domain-containing protein n=1 Tax=Giesbergeria anulus TaxID=180197 RepID=A0A1H9QGP5_9BURK|nr:EAL domain-containing protein [Giesbergeria anulus]SER59721.1 PAS domain S-box-containing protein/diguanylate cyclase (GGDEF) domain-containing protein [Giesbergeria anulus]
MLSSEVKRRHVLWVLSAVVLAIGWLSALGFTLWRLREDALSNGLAQAVIHARHFEEHLTQTMQLIDFAAENINPLYKNGIGPKDLGPRLRELLRPMPYLRSIAVLDEHGQVLDSSNPANIGMVIDLQGFYPSHNPEAPILRIGNPWQGRDFVSASIATQAAALSPTEPHLVPVLRRLSGTEKTQWLLTAINPDYFINYASNLMESEHGYVQWLRYDDVLLMSASPHERAGTAGAAGHFAQGIARHEQGVLEQQLPTGQQVLTAYRVSSRFPIVVAAQIDRDAVLAQWATEARRLAGIFVPSLLALAVVGFAALRRQQRLAQQQAQLDEERSLAASVFESSSDAIIITTPDAHILSVNPAFERVTGYSTAEALNLNPRFMASGVQDSTFYAQMWATLLRYGHWEGEIFNRHKQGHLYTVLLRINAVKDAAHQLRHYVGTITDVTQKNAAQEQLKLAASVFSHAREGIMITSPQGDMIEVNAAFSRITGYRRDEVIGKNSNMLSSGRQGADFYANMWAELSDKGRWTGEIWNRRKSGEVYAEMLTISAVCDVHAKVLRYVALFSDISQQKENEKRLEHIAHYDALTGLPNRVLLADRLRQAIVQAGRYAKKLAVVFLDLDGFKAINDTYGHAMGDKLLIELAVRMQHALRDGDTIARIGGDEFVAVLAGLSQHEAAGVVLDRLLIAAAQPVLTDGVALQVSASVGVAFFPQSEEVDADQLLRQADQAMYQAKVTGKNRYHVFDAEQDRHLRGHHEGLENIRQALQKDEFALYYQPKVNMRTGEVVGAEALIRWLHPERGVLAPAAFLPALESDELAVQMGEWVLETAMAQIETWKAQGLSLPVSVNMDARQLQQPDFVTRLRHLLALHPHIGAGDLELEVLETNALDDIPGISRLMDACHEMGVGFALDDFGTGYSSLTYLRRLPAKLLKIDQSFVRDMLDDPDDMAILEGVLGLARVFRRQVIAEGVETVAHGVMLLRLGCEWGQGYAIARPMPATEMPNWLATWRPEPSWLHLPHAQRDDLPLLFAMVEHRAWVTGITSYLRGERSTAPVLDLQNCRFSHWLQHEGGRKRHADNAMLEKIEQLHQKIHAQAEALVALKHQGQEEIVLERLPDIYVLRDALLEKLPMLLEV